MDIIVEWTEFDTRADLCQPAPARLRIILEKPRRMRVLQGTENLELNTVSGFAKWNVIVYQRLARNFVITNVFHIIQNDLGIIITTTTITIILVALNFKSLLINVIEGLLTDNSRGKQTYKLKRDIMYTCFK
ncbi:hypothetical protein ACFE04_002858 [Oxalis oulophora]